MALAIYPQNNLYVENVGDSRQNTFGLHLTRNVKLKAALSVYFSMSMVASNGSMKMKPGICLLRGEGPVGENAAVV